MSIRMVHEAQMHSHNEFITWTYDDDHVPHGHTLVKKHVQDLFKRMRYYYPNISHVTAGEYGGKGSRPHYHSIVFGLHLTDKEHYGSSNGHKLFRSEKLNSIWGKGNVILGEEVNRTTCMYVMEYALKDMRLGEWKDNYEIVCPYTGEIHQRIEPFITMSKNPAIGKRWYRKYSSDVFPKDFIVIEGKKYTAPDYYLYLLSEDDPQQAEKVKLKRAEKLESIDESELSEERLEVKETLQLIGHVKKLKKKVV